MSILQRLYDSEINFEVSGFYDAGFDVRLGDALNGFLAEGKVETWAEAEAWLRDQALAHFPDSEFARTNSERRKPLKGDGTRAPTAPTKVFPARQHALPGTIQVVPTTFSHQLCRRSRVQASLRAPGAWQRTALPQLPALLPTLNVALASPDPSSVG